MKYVIFADVDGTIYSDGKPASEDTKKDIAYAQSQGYEFVLNTGNGPFDKMKNLAKELNARYLVTSNGATIYDSQINSLIYKSPIKKEKANKILEIAMNKGISADFWDENLVYFNEHALQKNFDIVEKAMGGKHKIENYAQGDIFKFEFYVTDDQIHLLDELQKVISPKEFNIARMWPTHMEVTNIGVSKGQALIEFCKLHNLNPNEMMAIGDSANDYSMFEVVDYSYAMGNSNELTKSKTKYLTDDVFENGLGKAIKDYIIRTQGEK